MREAQLRPQRTSKRDAGGRRIWVGDVVALKLKRGESPIVAKEVLEVAFDIAAGSEKHAEDLGRPSSPFRVRPRDGAIEPVSCRLEPSLTDRNTEIEN
jgi:hypothetical protein